MNKTFSFKRFFLLVRHQGTENYKFYAILWALITLFILILAGFNNYPSFSTVYIIMFCFGGCVVATTSLSQWNNIGRSSFFLLIPATITEKFLCSLFFGIILYVPLFLFTYLFTRFFLVNITAVLFFNPGASFSELMHTGFKDITFAAFPLWVRFSLMSLMFAQSIFMITAISFRKRQFLIALLIICFVWIIYGFGADFLMSKLIVLKHGRASSPGIIPYASFEFWYSSSPNHYEYFNLIKAIQYLNNIIWLIIFGILYFSGWLKLKEREI